jgi:hypothetical protein
MVSNKQQNSRYSNKRICYYCGNLGETREHVPPKCFFGDTLHNPLTVYACKQHNEGKSKSDQVMLKAMLYPLRPTTDIQYQFDTKLKWDDSRKGTLDSYKKIAQPTKIKGISAPIEVVHMTTVDLNEWILQLTAGIMFGVYQCSVVDWNNSVTYCWDYIPQDITYPLTKEQIEAWTCKQKENYIDLAPSKWHGPHYPKSVDYPESHYTYRIAPHHKVWIVEHTFFQQYRFWGSFVLDDDNAHALMEQMNS